MSFSKEWKKEGIEFIRRIRKINKLMKEDF
jgi:hypothetical protein